MDGVLCWDLFDYLDKHAAAALASQIVRDAEAGGRGARVLQHARAERAGPGRSTPSTSSSIRRTLQYRPYPAARGKQRPFQNRDIQRMFEPLRITEQFLLKSHMREVLFRKAGDAAAGGRLMDFELTDEHRLVEQSVREWAGREVAPRIRELDRAHTLRPRPAAADGVARAARHLGAGGARRLGHGLPRARPRLRRARVRGHVAARDPLGARRPQLAHASQLGHRRSEGALPRAAGAGRAHRDLRPHRAGGRQRCPRHPDRGGEEGRPLRPDRREDVDLAGRRRRPRAGVRLDRSGQEEGARPVGHERLHRRARLPRVLERHAHREVGHPRRQHRLPQAGRRGSAGGESGGARRRRASRSRCSRSTRAASPWPPAPPG